MSKNQNGFSVLEGLLILVIIAILAGTGWYVYGSNKKTSDLLNNAAKSNDVVAQDSIKQSDKKPVDLTSSLDPSFPAKLSFTYPATWTLSETHWGDLPLISGQTVDQTVTITSPSKKYSVRYRATANGGLGGACEPNDHGTIVSANSSALKNFADASFAENIYTNPPYTENAYFSGIMKTSAVSGIKSGDTICKIYLAQVIDLTPKEHMTLLEAGIHVAGLNDPSSWPDPVPTNQSDIENAFKSNEYQQATAIIKSSTLEK